MERAKVMIAGGGTGGHVYPAITIADAIREQLPDASIRFVGAKGRLEMEKVPKAGYPIQGLWISGFQRRLSWSNLLFPIKLLWSYLRAWAMLRRFKPDLAIGVGGYASGPLLHVASLQKVPTLIQEQNSYAGITNRLLGKRADRICVAFEGMERCFPADRIVQTGNPVRKDLTKPEGKAAEGKAHFGLSKDSPLLLILGGSLGARSINESVLEHKAKWVGEGLELLWQTGSRYYEEVKQRLGDEAARVHVHPFIDRMDLAYAAADMVIARAGAITVSEIAKAGKPAIFIPSPHVAEDHQTKNARALVDKDAAMIVTDNRAKEEIGEKVLELLQDPEKRNRLSGNMKKAGVDDPAKRIAEEAISLMKGKG